MSKWLPPPPPFLPWVVRTRLHVWHGAVNLFAKLLFSWVSPLMTRGNKKYLDEEVGAWVHMHATSSSRFPMYDMI